MSRASLVAYAAEPPTLTRPRTSVPSMVKKRRGSFSLGVEEVASSCTPPYPAVGAAGDQLGEHHRHPAVLGRVADVVLAGRLVRRVQVEGLRLGVVGAGRPQ